MSSLVEYRKPVAGNPVSIMNLLLGNHTVLLDFGFIFLCDEITYCECPAPSRAVDINLLVSYSAIYIHIRTLIYFSYLRVLLQIHFETFVTVF